MVEDILLNPNIAYILLVSGFSMALLAVITPGTGILEISGIFALLLAGWALYNLPINYWALAILLLGVIPFVVAIVKAGHRLFLGLSILMVIVGSVFLFRGDVWWRPEVNPVLAAVVSILVGGFFWFAAQKTLEARATPPAHDLAPLIDAIGEAKSDIHHEGTAQVRGELWSVYSAKPISSGAQVRVISRDGFVLEVEEVK
jgi:membrane-bound serine protease (ClpP class)